MGGSPFCSNTSFSGQVFWCNLKISSGSTAICAASACVSAWPRAHLGMGLRSFSASSSESLLSDPLLQAEQARSRHAQKAGTGPEMANSTCTVLLSTLQRVVLAHVLCAHGTREVTALLAAYLGDRCRNTSLVILQATAVSQCQGQQLQELLRQVRLTCRETAHRTGTALSPAAPAAQLQVRQQLRLQRGVLLFWQSLPQALTASPCREWASLWRGGTPGQLLTQQQVALHTHERFVWHVALQIDTTLPVSSQAQWMHGSRHPQQYLSRTAAIVRSSIPHA